MNREAAKVNPQDKEIRLEIEPLEFSVHLKKTWQISGIRAKLCIDADGIALSQIQFQPGKTVALLWGQVRALRTEKLMEKKAFEVDLGPGNESVLYPIVILGGSFDRLVAALNQLPESVRDKKCVACGGPVREGKCRACGADLAMKLRAKGLRTMAIGAGGAVLGAVMTAASYESTKPGGSFFVFTGLIIFGVVYFIVGLINAIAGKNIK